MKVKVLLTAANTSLLCRSLACGIALLTTASGLMISSQPSQAQNPAAAGFTCDTSGGVPVTIYIFSTFLCLFRYLLSTQ